MSDTFSFATFFLIMLLIFSLVKGAVEFKVCKKTQCTNYYVSIVPQK